MRRNGNGSVTVQLPGGEAELAEIVRILDRADLHVQTLQLHQPSLDDVFLAKTGRKLEGSADDASAAAPAEPAAVAGGGAVAVDAAAGAASLALRGSGEPARADARGRPPLGGAHLAPARAADLPDGVPVDPVRDQRLGAERRDEDPELPDRTTTATS